MRRLARLWFIAFTVLRFGLDEVALRSFRQPWVRVLVRVVTVGRRLDAPRGVRLRQALERLGPLFVKFGQVLSTRRDLVPQDLAEELALLQDRVPPFPAAQSAALVERALGRPLEAIFQRFEAEPVASASIAQVHFARLRSDLPGRVGEAHAGREVAVKVLRPGMLDAIESDLELLHTLARWVERLAECRRLWLQRGVGVMLRQWMSESGVAARLLARADGERRLTNLLHLLETLQAASAEHTSPAALLRWFERQRREGATEDALQLRLESDANLVQIQTIHGAKGLEFPVVVCPFLWDGSLTEPPNDLGCRSYHDAAGTAVLDFDEPDAGVKARIQQEKAAERLRLLYVALTRAVHRCVLVAGGYLAASGSSLSPKESGRSLLNWLVAGGGSTPEGWFESGIDLAAADAAWQALGARLPDAVRVRRLVPAAAPRRLTPATAPTEPLQARRPPR